MINLLISFRKWVGLRMWNHQGSQVTDVINELGNGTYLAGVGLITQMEVWWFERNNDLKPGVMRQRIEIWVQRLFWYQQLILLSKKTFSPWETVQDGGDKPFHIFTTSLLVVMAINVE